MPNQCKNHLSIINGDISELNPYISDALTSDKKHLDIDKIFDNELQKIVDKLFIEELYSDTGKIEGNTFEFLTPWKPPIYVVKKLSEKMNKSIRLAYSETGMDFIGEMVVHPNATMQINESKTEDAPEHLLKEFGLDTEDDQAA